MNNNDSDLNDEDVIALRNQNLLLCAIHQALPEPVEQRIRSYFRKCLAKNPEVRFHGSLDRDTAISFFLYWLIEYDPEGYQEKLFGYPHSNISTLHCKFLPFLTPFSDHVINFKNYEYRRTAANSFHTQYKHSLSDITLVGDSTPIPLEWTHNEERSGEEGTWCNRVKGPAYKVTAIMDLSHRFCFVSDAVPYAHHDIHRLKEYWPTIKGSITEKDCLALDTGYLSFDRSDRGGKFHIKKRSAKNHPLSKEDLLFNVKIEESRRFVEIEFDKLKSTFRITKHKYRGDRKDLSDYIRFCFALHNEIAEHAYSPKKYSNEWDGPLVRLEFKKKGNKGARKYAFVTSDDSDEEQGSDDPVLHDSDVSLPRSAPSPLPKHQRKRQKTENKKS